MAKTPVELPEGMTVEEFTKLFGTFVKNRTEGQYKGKATAKAVTRLKAAHQADYDRFYEEEYAKAKAAG
jgi:hypothetical protein